MRPDAAHVEHLERWMRSRLPGFAIESGHLDRPGGVLFRARNAGGRGTPLELEISDEAFEDHRVEEIVRDLEARRTIEHLTRRPGVRLMFDTMGRVQPTDRHS